MLASSFNNKTIVIAIFIILQMECSVLPLHRHPEYLQTCCDLINSEWKRSNTARLRSLQSSCDRLPVSLILLKGKKLIGHLKLSSIPGIKDACFVESVVILKEERKKGYGSVFMHKTEEFCRTHLKINMIYLSTKGQEGFYSKLGYIKCMPISMYGSFASNSVNNANNRSVKANTAAANTTPIAPPMPKNILGILTTPKIYMKKEF